MNGSTELSPAAFQRCWYLTGPTASGKTQLGLLLARQLDAEIISLDSMAIYQNMDIGTAKPSKADQRQIPHHLLDIVEPTDTFSVSKYRRQASQAVQQIEKRGKPVLFVGGTPLYLKTLLRGIFVGPAADHQLRERIHADLQLHGHQALHQRLRQVDPLSAAKLHPHDVRRVIRALEVYTLTGTPISHLQMQFDNARPAKELRVFVLEWPRETLHTRIDARVDQMFASGLVAEVENLLQKYGQLGRTAAQAVGYREVLRHLQGQWDLQETIRNTKQRTRQFAKRQLTWFRSLQECRWLPLTPEKDAQQVIREIIASASDASTDALKGPTGKE